jgi:hypothetical protein
MPPRPAWSTFGPHPIGAERFVTVSSGKSFAQVAGTILRKQARGQNPDKDVVAPGASVIDLSVPSRSDLGRRGLGHRQQSEGGRVYRRTTPALCLVDRWDLTVPGMQLGRDRLDTPRTRA